VSDTHTLVITMHSDCIDMEPTDVDYDIECPGVSDACRMWVECDIPNCENDSGHNAGELIHGKRHQYVGDSWSVPTDTCYLAVADEMPDAADYLATKHQLGVGRYVVGHDFDEGRIADFQLLREEAAL